MKRIVKSSVAPKPLSDYIVAHAVGTREHDWDVFRDTVPKADKLALQRQVKADQRGICAYCEIDLADADGSMLMSGGSGQRFGADKPKQYCLMGGRPIIEYAINVCRHAANVDEIIRIAV